tara:strand:+ start:489 stop:1292 length:804 start_codon:yes stop_codon:yes gene_type:complete
MAMNKGLKATLIILGVGVTGFGAYLLYKKVIKPKLDAKKDEEEAKKKPPISENDVKSSSYNKKPKVSASSTGKTPFKNSTEGNAFRKWVNDNHPQYASRIDLDPTGSYDNAYIRKAWKEYGSDYTTAEKNKGAVYTATYGQKFADLLKDWKKSHLLSTASSTKDVPYFELNMGIFGGSTLGCVYDIYIYDRKLGENVGGTNGKGYWKVVTKDKGKSVVVASGRWSNSLRTLEVVTGNKKGQTYSGGQNVGTKFSEIIVGNPSTLKWC